VVLHGGDGTNNGDAGGGSNGVGSGGVGDNNGLAMLVHLVVLVSH
jgi:hypothetical protein